MTTPPICGLCVENIDEQYAYHCERPFRGNVPYHLTCLLAVLESDLRDKRHIPRPSPLPAPGQRVRILRGWAHGKLGTIKQIANGETSCAVLPDEKQSLAVCNWNEIELIDDD